MGPLDLTGMHLFALDLGMGPLDLRGMHLFALAVFLCLGGVGLSLNHLEGISGVTLF